MGIVFKIIVYVFGFIGLLLSISFVSVYILLYNKIIDEKTFLERVQKYTRVNFSVVCKSSESEEKSGANVTQKPHNIWLIENLEVEQAAKSLLSLGTEEIVRYLETIDREKSLKILENLYAILDEQGDTGKKRKQDIDKKIFGGLK